MLGFRGGAGSSRDIALALCMVVAAWSVAPAAAGPVSGPIAIRVDATNTGQQLLQVSERLPVTPGTLRLLFPRWLPGFHGPYGDVGQIAGLEVAAAGKRLPWRRDPMDPFAFVVEVPPGAMAVELRFQSMPSPESQPYRSARSRQALGLQWHGAVLYPAGIPAADIVMQPSVKLPPGWKYGTSLRVSGEREGWLEFEAVSLEMLIDAPVYAGQYYRRIELDAPGTPWPAALHLFGDRADRLEASDSQIEAHRSLVRQATAIFGTRPWRHYDLLIAIGEGLPDTALEHHESSENIYITDYFKDWASAVRRRDDVAHEFVHSWNGKYRRPADLWAPDFNTPSQNTLLWVYEGLTQYWGMVIAARSGLVSAELTRRHFGLAAAYLRELPGRRWRDLQDTTNVPATGATGVPTWSDWQRHEEYYMESAVLIWLDADTLIREGTHGQRSLDDFGRGFFGGTDGERGPRLYRFDDVVAAMNAVYPHDWETFFRARLDRTTAQVPLDGFERSGWRVAFAEKRSAADLADLDPEKPVLKLNFSLGLNVGKDGKLVAVAWDGPAFRAGLAPQDQIVAVAMQDYTPGRLEAAITANKDASTPLELLVRSGDDYRIVKLDVRTGLRYPMLERIPDSRDWLNEILSAR